jgi:hypothetical protein
MSGHEAGDSKGQQGCLADSCALALTSGEGSEQQRSPGRTVYGMQGVRHPPRRPCILQRLWVRLLGEVLE